MHNLYAAQFEDRGSPSIKNIRLRYNDKNDDDEVSGVLRMFGSTRCRSESRLI